MDTAVSQVFLVTFSGISLADLEAAPSAASSSDKTTTWYTKIPKRFTGVETWPTSSNRKCLVCDLQPRGYPRFIPKSPVRVDGKFECDVEGHFCEWNCAVQWIRWNYPPNEQRELEDLITYIESLWTGVRRLRILLPPDKKLLKPYDGDQGLSVEEWYKLIDQRNAL